MKQRIPLRSFPPRAALPWLAGAAFVVAGALTPAGLAWVFTHPPRRFHTKNPRVFGIPYQRVSLRTRDDLRLSAWYVPSMEKKPRGVVVVCHGYFGNRATMLPHLRFLHDAGYAALLLDFRAHGWSGGRMATLGCRETLDVTAALDWVSAHPELWGLPVALLGESMGASVALMVAADDARVRAVVADAAFARLDNAVASRLRLTLGPLANPIIQPTQSIGERLLGISCAEVAPVEAIARIAPRPVFLIHGTEDRLIAVDNGRELLRAAPGNATLWEVPGAGHVMSIYTAPEEYARRVLEFLQEALARTP